MASTNKTKNFNLSQFVQTDKPTFLGDYNSDMNKIDTALETVKDGYTNADVKIGDLTQLTTDNKLDLVDAINEIDAKEKTLDTNVTENTNSIANVDTKVNNLETRVNNLSTGYDFTHAIGYNYDSENLIVDGGAGTKNSGSLLLQFDENSKAFTLSGDLNVTGSGFGLIQVAIKNTGLLPETGTQSKTIGNVGLAINDNTNKIVSAKCEIFSEDNGTIRLLADNIATSDNKTITFHILDGIHPM